MTAADDPVRDLVALAGTLTQAAPRPVILIDGRSGAGKSIFAGRLAQAWPGPVRLLALDDLYPGWTGLAAGADQVAESILRPVEPGYRRWDWAIGAPADWVPVDGSAPLIIEGCGALTAANRALASYGIWVEAPATLRRDRAMTRDADSWADQWALWATQEDEHLCRNHPRDLADLVVTTDESASRSW